MNGTATLKLSAKVSVAGLVVVSTATVLGFIVIFL
jgi:hypothetical protein